MGGSSSAGAITDHHRGPSATPVPSNTLVSATMAPNVEHLMWDFSPDMHETMENLCDVYDMSPMFPGQPGVLANYDPSYPTREACMMRGRPQPEAGVVPMGGTADLPEPGTQPVSRGSIIHFSMLGAAYPEVIAGIEYSEQLDEEGGSDVVDLTSTSLAQVASCMWNPEWKHVATVSMTTTRSSPTPGVAGESWGYEGENRWCPSGSAFIGGRAYLPVGEDAYRISCLDYGVNVSHEPNNCVRAAAPGTLTMAMNPERLVRVEPEWVGLRMRAEAMIGNRLVPNENPQVWSPDPSIPPVIQSGPVASRSCYAAWGWKYGIHARNLPYGTPVRGRLFFLDDFGNLLDESGVPLGAVGCSSQPLELTTQDHTAEVRPASIDFTDASVANAFVFGVVPSGAAWVGIRLDVPGIQLANYEPVVSDATIVVEVPSEGGSRLELTRTGSAAFSWDPATGTSQYPIPQRCNDHAWYRASAGNGMDAAYQAERQCLELMSVE